MALTTAEMMALAVLKGDLLAARALADHLSENAARGGVQLPPVKVLTTADPERLRAVVFVKDNAEADQDALTELQVALSAWLRGGKHPVIPLTGIDRIEVYELPPPGTATGKAPRQTTSAPSCRPSRSEDAGVKPILRECVDPKEYD